MSQRQADARCYEEMDDAELIVSAKAGDVTARKVLIERKVGLMLRVAERLWRKENLRLSYQSGAINEGDLVQEMAMNLLEGKGLASFDPAKGKGRGVNGWLARAMATGVKPSKLLPKHRRKGKSWISVNSLEGMAGEDDSIAEVVAAIVEDDARPSQEYVREVKHHLVQSLQAWLNTHEDTDLDVEAVFARDIKSAERCLSIRCLLKRGVGGESEVSEAANRNATGCVPCSADWLYERKLLLSAFADRGRV